MFERVELNLKLSKDNSRFKLLLRNVLSQRNWSWKSLRDKFDANFNFRLFGLVFNDFRPIVRRRRCKTKGPQQERNAVTQWRQRYDSKGGKVLSLFLPFFYAKTVASPASILRKVMLHLYGTVALIHLWQNNWMPLHSYYISLIKTLRRLGWAHTTEQIIASDPESGKVRLEVSPVQFTAARRGDELATGGTCGRGVPRVMFSRMTPSTNFHRCSSKLSTCMRF